VKTLTEGERKPSAESAQPLRNSVRTGRSESAPPPATAPVAGPAQ
jgi:hypothetical protein